MSQGHKTEITIALITLIGVVVSGLFANWDKVFPENDQLTTEKDVEKQFKNKYISTSPIVSNTEQNHPIAAPDTSMVYETKTDKKNEFAKVKAKRKNQGELYKSCNDVKNNNTNSKDGNYEIDVDGKEGPIEAVNIYCDMTTQNGGWTLYATHSDGIANIQTSKNLTPNYYGVIPSTVFTELVKNMKSGMLFKDEHGRVSFINKRKLNKGNCLSINSIRDLTSPIRNTGGIWHNENSGCGNGGSDYSLIQLQNSNYGNYGIAGAALYQHSTVKFDIWPYKGPYSYKQQNKLNYYIK